MERREISIHGFPAEEEMRRLFLDALQGKDIELEMRTGSPRFRAPGLSDPNILVAVCGGAGGALVALINAIFRVLEKKHSDIPVKIVLKGDEIEMEVPPNISQAQLEKLVNVATTLLKLSIHIVNEENAGAEGPSASLSAKKQSP